MPPPDSSSQRCFELRSKIDGLIYRYRPCEPRNGFPAWKREDLAIWLVWAEAYGWVGVNEQDEVTGVPWAVALHEQLAQPPAGIWVTRKGDKSYVYVLVYV